MRIFVQRKVQGIPYWQHLRHAVQGFVPERAVLDGPQLPRVRGIRSAQALWPELPSDADEQLPVSSERGPRIATDWSPAASLGISMKIFEIRVIHSHSNVVDIYHVN